ncbi:polysaccharide deacetylase family protein [Novosphingobium sp.]|uniref:polysaccharide deacetylase family protein n=1 Tax=Novosphingobium sp. TaxID=1874826 RepID=UPI003BA8EEAA
MLRKPGLICAAALGLLTPAAHARDIKVALTFDDLPALSIVNQQAYIDTSNVRLLSGLKRHHFPAIGFVNEGKLDEGERAAQIANLKRWLNAGMDLGNHTLSHESPNTLGAEGYIADIARGEPVLRSLMAQYHQRLSWFRHPYLETGYPAPVKTRINNWLSAHGYRIAPVTIDADDWEFAEPYDDAIARGDTEAQRHIKGEYLAYTEKLIRWSLASSRNLFGRGIAQVMLLHCTRLNADTIDDLAALLGRLHLHPVRLSRAMRDRAYRIPDTYDGKDGINWLERWSLSLHKDLPDTGNEDPPEDIRKAYDRVDTDPGR